MARRSIGLRGGWRSVKIPWYVFNAEQLARRCDKPKKIRAGEFVRNNSYPYDVSTARIKHGPALTVEDIANGKHYALIHVGTARRLNNRPRIWAAKEPPDPPHHAVIVPRPIVDSLAFANKERAVEYDPRTWAEFLKLCEDLRDIATFPTGAQRSR